MILPLFLFQNCRTCTGLHSNFVSTLHLFTIAESMAYRNVYAREVIVCYLAQLNRINGHHDVSTAKIN